MLSVQSKTCLSTQGSHPPVSDKGKPNPCRKGFAHTHTQPCWVSVAVSDPQGKEGALDLWAQSTS